MVVAPAVVVITGEDGVADAAAEKEPGSSGLRRPHSSLHPSTSLGELCHSALGWVDSSSSWVCRACRAYRAYRGMQGMQGASVVAPVMSPAVLGQPLGLSADTQSPGLAQLAVQIQQGAGRGGIPMVLSDQTAMLLLQQGMQVADTQAKAASQAQALWALPNMRL